jgi:hypothetical protein
MRSPRGRDWGPYSVVEAPYNRWDRWLGLIGTSGAFSGAPGQRRCAPNPTGPTQTRPVRQDHRAGRVGRPGWVLRPCGSLPGRLTATLR